MTFWSFSMEKMNKFPNEMIHITLRYAMHLHGHWNKMVPLLKPSIIADLRNGVKFHSCTYWWNNDTQNHYLSHRINNHHISNEDLFFSNHVEIGS